MMRLRAISPENAIATGAILALPMALIVSGILLKVRGIEGALTSLFTDGGGALNVAGYVFVAVAFLGLPVGLTAMLLSLLRRRHPASPSTVLAGIAVSAAIIALMVPSWGAIATEVYRCEILGLPNCD